MIGYFLFPNFKTLLYLISPFETHSFQSFNDWSNTSDVFLLNTDRKMQGHESFEYHKEFKDTVSWEMS
jgi:hypothetical protein